MITFKFYSSGKVYDTLPRYAGSFLSKSELTKEELEDYRMYVELEYT